MSSKIGFLFLVPADLALICWLKVETFLNNLTYGKPSSRVVLYYNRIININAQDKVPFPPSLSIATILKNP